MRQSRLMSAAEAVTNVAVGYGLAVAANRLVLPVFGFDVTVADSAAIGAIFTGIALMRSYLVRRAFDALGACSRAGEARSGGAGTEAAGRF